MNFKPTPEQQALIDSARRDLELARELPGSPSDYFVDKCSSEAGICRPAAYNPPKCRPAT
jgi:hypothetical protein